MVGKGAISSRFFLDKVDEHADEVSPMLVEREEAIHDAEEALQAWDSKLSLYRARNLAEMNKLSASRTLLVRRGVTSKVCDGILEVIAM